MVLFNYATRELTAKIVYYGAGLCGKTTNLEYVHKSLPEKTRGKMLSLATQTDRTLFFDFLPVDLGSVRGMKTRVQLYTVPGQVFYDATRKLVLKGADGVVFVVDSQKEMLESNLDSWENLKQNLMENNLDINSIPMVVQYNKRDLPNILPIRDLDEKINILNAPSFEAIALSGMGVQETLKGVAKIVLKSLSKKYGRRGEEEEGAEEAVNEEASVSVPVLTALPPDDAVELSALEEEVKELPNADELEVGEEALHLEPIESIEDSPMLGEVEDVVELQEIREEEPEELSEIHEEVLESPPQEMEEKMELPPEAPKKTTRKKRTNVDEIFAEVAKKSGSSLSVDPSLLVDSLRKSATKKPDLKTVDMSAEKANQSAPAKATISGVDHPVDITITRDGQDIKLNLTITLRVRFED